MKNNQHIRFKGFPIVKEIKAKGIEKVNIHDPNFDKPLSNLERDYNEKQTGILIFKVN